MDSRESFWRQRGANLEKNTNQGVSIRGNSMNETLWQRCENHGTPENSEQPGLQGTEQEEMKLQSEVKDSFLLLLFLRKL